MFSPLMKPCLLIALFLSWNGALSAQELKPDIAVHDPVMIKQGDAYYIFCTGWGISMWSSKDMVNWKREKPVFDKAPQWAVETIPGFKGHIWAPDISYYQGNYYLYYSISLFGKNTSCIGVATNVTLDPNDKNYQWVDHGKVIQSIPGKTNWNAIDPNLIADESGTPYLFFGSFWGGLRMVKLNPDRLSVAETLEDLPTIASRKTDLSTKENPPSVDDNPIDAGGDAIEAPFVFKKEGYYYLTASIDYCCKGPRSTYKMIVGRSRDIRGPYLDKAGVSLAHGGGTILQAGDKDWYGVGHDAICEFDGINYLIFHGYDAADKGKSKLRIKKLSWDKEGWPFVASEEAPPVKSPTP
jgi:arabinan endo-1,5-alpha-L-arabinosidase